MPDTCAPPTLLPRPLLPVPEGRRRRLRPDLRGFTLDPRHRAKARSERRPSPWSARWPPKPGEKSWTEYGSGRREEDGKVRERHSAVWNRQLEQWVRRKRIFRGRESIPARKGLACSLLPLRGPKDGDGDACAALPRALLQQPARRGAGFVGDGRAGEHAGNLFAALRGFEHRYPGGDPVSAAGLRNQVM